MFHEILKAATTIDHQNAEKHSYGREIMGKTLNPAQYAQLVIANYMYIAPWEQQWSTADFDQSALSLSSRSKIDALHKDLEELGINPATIDCIELSSAATKAQFLGRMYVIEGSTLGGAMISKQLLQNEHLTGLSFHFYKGYGPLLMPNWKSFLAELNTIEDASEQEEAIEWAKQAFQDMEKCFIKAKTMTLHS